MPANEGRLFVDLQVERPYGLDAVNGQMIQRRWAVRAVMDSSVPGWRKSSYSGDNGNCVEIAWRKGADGINILVRDSKCPGQQPLVFTPGEWAMFLERVKTGDFDVLASPAVAGLTNAGS
jgi:hypothetical protein